MEAMQTSAGNLQSRLTAKGPVRLAIAISAKHRCLGATNCPPRRY